MRIRRGLPHIRMPTTTTRPAQSATRRYVVFPVLPPSTPPVILAQAHFSGICAIIAQLPTQENSHAISHHQIRRFPLMNIMQHTNSIVVHLLRSLWFVECRLLSATLSNVDDDLTIFGTPPFGGGFRCPPPEQQFMPDSQPPRTGECRFQQHNLPRW